MKKILNDESSVKIKMIYTRTSEWVLTTSTLFSHQYLLSVIIYGEPLFVLLVAQIIEIYIIKRLRFIFLYVLKNTYRRYLSLR